MTPRKARPLKILIIEDDPDILNALNIVLGSEGFEVDVLLKGESILKNQFVKPDLLILDYGLPDTNGLAICRHLRSKPIYSDIPIIVISASPKAKSKVLEAGASAFVEKPFDLRHLIEVINNTLHGHASI